MKLLAKLPYYLDVKWRNVIKQWRHANGEASYPSFLKFAEFVREAAERVISANRPQIPKPEIAREWEHVKSVADRLTPYHPDAEISILIGNNCPKAIRPREIVAGGDDEPYALRTALG